MRYKHVEFPSDYKYLVVAFNTPIDDYRLTLLINKVLNINLSYINFLNSETSDGHIFKFPIFFFEDEVKKNTFYLINNFGQGNSQLNSQINFNLFSENAEKLSIKLIGKRKKSIYFLDNIVPDYTFIIGYPPCQSYPLNIDSKLKSIKSVQSINIFNISDISNYNQLLSEIELLLIEHNREWNNLSKHRISLLKQNNKTEDKQIEKIVYFNLKKND